MLVIQSVPGGWDPHRITFTESKRGPTLAEQLALADPADLPASVAELVAAVAEERQRLESFPDGQWNGESIAVEALSTRSRSREKEAPFLHLRVAPSDHASHSILNNYWLARYDATNGDLSQDLDKLAVPVPGMLQAIGVSATVVTADDQLILVRRSATTSSGRTGRHVSVDEGMLFKDRTDGRLDPAACLVRGVHEELGLDIRLSHVSIHTVMLDLRRYQLGLLGHVDLRDTSVTAADVMDRRRFGFPQDKYENRALEAIRWSRRHVESALNDSDWIAHGWLNLLTSAGQELKLDLSKVRPKPVPL